MNRKWYIRRENGKVVCEDYGYRVIRWFTSRVEATTYMQTHIPNGKVDWTDNV